MNRIRLTVLSGFVAVGYFNFGASPSRAQDQYVNHPTSAVASRVPMRGDSYTPSPAPAYSVPRYYAPQFFAPARVYHAAPLRASAWSYDPTGRHDRLARPWLQPSR